MRRAAVYCAIDRADRAAAEMLARSIKGHVGGLKLGLEFFTANGPREVEALQALGLPIFLDLKLHDIPNTVAGAVRAASALGVRYLTVHAAGGRAMLEAAAHAAAASPTPPKLLAITVLTSLDESDLVVQGIVRPVADQVMAMAELALGSGIDGLVCSPLEVEGLRRRFGPAPVLAVPGIRPAGGALGDQKRTRTPSEAQAAGADVLVIGRPISDAADPAGAARAIADELDRAAA
ncbi:MAG: orotidine-5'-phosphate decarboxylase [Geminicoccaceae bacterium]|nr:MAG: orotidine-5'-phosphate decarboxylase [Geminicoccaceae bacterium]